MPKLHQKHSSTHIHHLSSSTSSPLPKQSHDTGAQERRAQHKSQPLTIPGPKRIEQEIPRQKLHEPRIDQNSRAHRIQHPTDHISSEGVGIIRRSEPQSDGDCSGSRKTVSGAEKPWKPGARFEGDGRHSSADAETFEGLMEDEDGVESAELGADDAEVESDDDGVEYDTELEDQEGGDLLFESETASFRVANFEFLREAFFVISHRTSDVRSHNCILPIFDTRDGALDILLGAHIILDLHVALRSKVE